MRWCHGNIIWASRLNRFTKHHLEYFSYHKNCNSNCKQVKPGDIVRFRIQKKKKTVFCPGRVVFCSYFKGKSEYPIANWCKHVNKGAICWVWDITHSRFQRIELKSWSFYISVLTFKLFIPSMASNKYFYFPDFHVAKISEQPNFPIASWKILSLIYIIYVISWHNGNCWYKKPLLVVIF
jgi:hypothetical protein